MSLLVDHLSLDRKNFSYFLKVVRVACRFCFQNMAEELLKPWGNFSLSAEEEVDVEIEANEVERTISRG